jgi:hypothetical protein
VGQVRVAGLPVRPGGHLGRETVSTQEVSVFRTHRTSRAREAQQVAEQVWDRLATALETAGDAARSAGRRTYDYADDARSSAGAAAEEARRRAGAAIDAIAGRRTPLRWEWIVGAAVTGLVIGWLAAAGAGRAIATAESNEARADLMRDEAARPLDSAASPEF